MTGTFSKRTPDLGPTVRTVDGELWFLSLESPFALLYLTGAAQKDFIIKDTDGRTTMKIKQMRFLTDGIHWNNLSECPLTP